ncbi:pilin [Alicyclobacillus ferrooxydans]|uniref:Conjugal transfer protein n=1 Tax=Alicyclobacillus ferrooxydans TaxID=471514 RepID=A0A0N8PNX0_9BACL|nr:pilin [Alicyclobacillus ferrooxydans]KPV42701.1 hypothetical protein AN477_16360 [Alicyclobacillus ferrooxydans]
MSTLKSITEKFKTVSQGWKFALYSFLVLLLSPSDAYAANTLQGQVTNAEAQATTVGQWAFGIGFAFAGIVLLMKFLKMHSSEDDQDYKQAKKQLKWSLYGLIGAASAWVIVTYIKTTFYSGA